LALEYIILIITVLFFAANMGASGIAPSFAAVYGARLIGREKAVILFTLFVILGALVFGGRVVNTLSSGFIAKEYYTLQAALIVLLSASTSLFIANLLKVPQSTSWVTVTATLGAALYFRSLNWLTVLRMVGMWFLLPILAFILTYFIFKRIYPPRTNNFWFYEKAHLWKKPIRYLALICSCYVAFAIGSNNVANAVGPLKGAGLIDAFLGLLLVAPIFGLGGWMIGGKTMVTVGKEVVPLGLIASTLVSFVTANLLVVASILGFPQSLVQLNALAIMAIATIKHGHVVAVKQDVVKKVFLVWLIAPCLSGVISFLLFKLFLRTL
jgi:sulfate permease